MRRRSRAGVQPDRSVIVVTMWGRMPSAQPNAATRVGAMTIVNEDDLNHFRMLDITRERFISLRT